MDVLAFSYGLTRTHGWGHYGVEVLTGLRASGVAVKAYSGRGTESDDSVGSFAEKKLFSPETAERWRLFVAWLEAWRYLRAARHAAVVHALDEFSIPLAYYLSRISRRPLVVTLHGTYGVEMLSGPQQRHYRKMFAAASKLISVSAYTRQRILQCMPQVSGKVHVVPLGVNATFVESEPTRVEEREPVLLSVGAVKPRKGVLQAVNALGAVAGEAPTARLIVAGRFFADDPYVLEVRSAAEALGIGDRVELLGGIDDVMLNSLYRRARVLVMPSQNVGNHFEGFGLVHLEAAAKGLPAIGSTDCGNEAAILDGKTGFLVGQSDPSALANRVLRLLKDDDLWRRMSANALDFAGAMSWTRTVAETRRILETANRESTFG